MRLSVFAFICVLACACIFFKFVLCFYFCVYLDLCFNLFLCFCVFVYLYLVCICCCSAELKRMKQSSFLICSHCSTYCLLGMRMGMAMCNTHCVCICVCIFALICICVFVFVFVFGLQLLMIYNSKRMEHQANPHLFSLLNLLPVVNEDDNMYLYFYRECGIVFVHLCLNCSCCWLSAIQNG